MAKFVVFFFNFLSFEGICGATGTLDPPVRIGLSHAVCCLTLLRLGFMRFFDHSAAIKIDKWVLKNLYKLSED